MFRQCHHPLKVAWFYNLVMALIILTILIVYNLQLVQNRLDFTSGGMRSGGAHSPSQNEVVCVNGKSKITGGFCLSKDNILVGGNHVLDSELCKGLEDLFGHATVVDFGAGLGQYGRCLLRIKNNVVKSANPKEMAYLIKEFKAVMEYSDLYNAPKLIKSWKGYDGAENIEEISSGFINHLDLSREFDLKERWDWAISLEVGEHIPADREDIFIDNVARHACKGIVLSWAVPGQVGVGHINNQYNSHVIEKFKKRGFRHDLDDQTFLRKYLIFEYFLNTIMVFRAEDQNRCH